MTMMYEEKLKTVIGNMETQRGGGQGGMVDNRGIGKPATFKGQEDKYNDWITN